MGFLNMNQFHGHGPPSRYHSDPGSPCARMISWMRSDPVIITMHTIAIALGTS